MQTYAQIFQDDFCGYNENIFNNKKEVWYGNNEFLDYYIANYQLDSNKIYYRIPVTFWLYQDNAGEIGASEINVKREINSLNYYYYKNKTGISFYLSDMKIKQKTKRQVLGYYIEAPIITTVNKENGSINIHLVKNLQKNKVFGKNTYYRGTYNSLNKSIIAVRYNSEAGLSHEVGHYFGLRHPHENWDKGKLNQESVSRFRTKGNKLNCEVNGDKLCDTPAEPELSKDFDKQCNYTGELTDNWGDKYKPATNNIMSYQRFKSCREVFTKQQKAVMLYELEKNKNSKSWIVSSENLKYNFDFYEPDDVKIMYNEFFLDSLQYHTFHKIYKGVKQEDASDNVDWLRFKCIFNEPEIVVLNIRKGEVDFPKIKLTFTDLKKNILFEEVIQSDYSTEIELTKGYYFIKIKKINETVNLSDYIIELKSKINVK